MKNALYLLLILLIAGCTKKENPSVQPVKVGLKLPEQNSDCTGGSVFASNSTTVTFTWETAANTDIYELNVKNLLTGKTITEAATDTTAQIVLLNGTPYSWYVLSKSTTLGTDAKSDTWRFYVAGAGMITFDPFPAVLVSPTNNKGFTGGVTSVNLAWTGSDPDGDLVSYDVYLGTGGSLSLYKSNVTDTKLDNVPVTANDYFWEVVTKDSQGNTSDSGVFQFKIY